MFKFKEAHGDICRSKNGKITHNSLRVRQNITHNSTVCKIIRDNMLFLQRLIKE